MCCYTNKTQQALVHVYVYHTSAYFLNDISYCNRKMSLYTTQCWFQLSNAYYIVYAWYTLNLKFKLGSDNNATLFTQHGSSCMSSLIPWPLTSCYNSSCIFLPQRYKLLPKHYISYCNKNRWYSSLNSVVTKMLYCLHWQQCRCK